MPRATGVAFGRPKDAKLTLRPWWVAVTTFVSDAHPANACAMGDGPKRTGPAHDARHLHWPDPFGLAAQVIVNCGNSVVTSAAGRLC
jgi:hypothetical protein